MAIATSSTLTSNARAPLTKGTPWYADSELTDKRGEIGSDREAIHVGMVKGGSSQAHYDQYRRVDR